MRNLSVNFSLKYHLVVELIVCSSAHSIEITVFVPVDPARVCIKVFADVERGKRANLPIPGTYYTGRYSVYHG